MALTEVSGAIRDFSRSAISGAEAWLHPAQSLGTGSLVFVDIPIRVDVASNGNFTIELEEGHLYVLEVLFPDAERARIGRSVLKEFRVPTGGGNLGGIIGLPARNGMVRIMRSDPISGSSAQEQYIYNEVTGDLFERTE